MDKGIAERKFHHFYKSYEVLALSKKHQRLEIEKVLKLKLRPDQEIIGIMIGEPYSYAEFKLPEHLSNH